MENIPNIYIALTLGGIVVGMVIIISLLKIIGGIFSAMFGGGRQYLDDREGRVRSGNSMGCLMPFLLLIGLLAFGANSLRKSDLFKFNKLVEPAKPVETPKPAIAPPPTYPLDDDEVAFEDDPAPQPTPKGNLAEAEEAYTPCDTPYAFQADCFAKPDNAKKRMAELFEEFGDVGLVIKDNNGATGYAVLVYGFCSEQEAAETMLMYGIDGTVLPTEGLDILRYEGN